MAQSQSKKGLSKLSISSKRESEIRGRSPRISIIIPSYNEGPTLLNLVTKVLNVRLPIEKEIIIVDDGSTDQTKEILKKFSKSKKIKIINHKKNLGKGSAIINGLKIATGDLVLVQDADLEYNPHDIPNLLKPFKDKNIRVVYGSRILGNNPSSHWTFSLGGRLLTLITNVLFNTKITDEATGYKVFRKEVISKINLKSKGFEFCPEITAKVAKLNIKIHEVPISYNPRSVSEKKIKWWDGIEAIYYLFKYRFSD